MILNWLLGRVILGKAFPKEMGDTSQYLGGNYLKGAIVGYQRKEGFDVGWMIVENWCYEAQKNVSEKREGNLETSW